MTALRASGKQGPGPDDENGRPTKSIEDLREQLRIVTAVADRLTGRMGLLESRYTLAGGEVRDLAQKDLQSISLARNEAERIMGLLRGSDLAARYVRDAHHHRRAANGWRLFAIAELLIAGAAVTICSKVLELTPVALSSLTCLLLVLFGYSAIESSNHRRREFDRSRIALRVSALEGYTESNRSAEGKVSQEAEAMMARFVEKHFIDPALDPNDMGTPRLQFSIIRTGDRFQQEPTTKA